MLWDVNITMDEILLFFEDVRAHCYCASLLRTQIHTPRHASRARSKKQNKQ